MIVNPQQVCKFETNEDYRSDLHNLKSATHAPREANVILLVKQ